MPKHKKKTILELCNYLGQDLDHPMCQELIQHVRECPECQFYIDTVKLTVNVYRTTHPDEAVPDSVKHNLLKSIHTEK